MTKVVILGQAEAVEPEKKKIEFVKAINGSGEIVKSYSDPKDYKNIELISIRYIFEFDIMFAYNDNRNNGVLYLGYFNDGVV